MPILTLPVDVLETVAASCLEYIGDSKETQGTHHFAAFQVP